MEWKLADAKNRFSEVVNRALLEGPQVISRRGDTVMVLSRKDYEKLLGKPSGFKAFLMEGPSFEELDLSRSPSPMRDVTL